MFKHDINVHAVVLWLLYCIISEPTRPADSYVIGHPRFFNQISSGLDIVGLAAAWLTAVANTDVCVRHRNISVCDSINV